MYVAPDGDRNLPLSRMWLYPRLTSAGPMIVVPGGYAPTLAMPDMREVRANTEPLPVYIPRGPPRTTHAVFRKPPRFSRCELDHYDTVPPYSIAPYGSTFLGPPPVLTRLL